MIHVCQTYTRVGKHGGTAGVVIVVIITREIGHMGELVVGGVVNVSKILDRAHQRRKLENKTTPFQNEITVRAIF